jgi:hypothetical protein
MLWCTQISVDVGGQVAALCAHLPTAYPSDAVPLVVLEGQGITPAVIDWAVARLDEVFVPGEAVLYTWVEEVRLYLEATLVVECKEAPTAAAAAAATGAEDVAVERDTEVRLQLHTEVKLKVPCHACCMLWRPGVSHGLWHCSRTFPTWSSSPSSSQHSGRQLTSSRLPQRRASCQGSRSRSANPLSRRTWRPCTAARRLRLS